MIAVGLQIYFTIELKAIVEANTTKFVTMEWIPGPRFLILKMKYYSFLTIQSADLEIYIFDDYMVFGCFSYNICYINLLDKRCRLEKS